MLDVDYNKALLNQIILLLDSENKLITLSNKISNRLYNNILDDLYNEFTSILLRILVQEYHYTKDNGQLKGVNRKIRFEEFKQLISLPRYCIYLFDKYKMLKKILNDRFNSYIDYIAEIINNYSEDNEKINSTFKSDFGPIIKICTGKGDLHGGKSVAEIIFENGCLYYKPRNMLNDMLIDEFLDIVNKYKFAKYNKVNFLSLNDHSWQENIEYQECNNLSEAKEYYYNAGIILAIAYVLKAYDIHHENIICMGNQPFILDWETLSYGYTVDSNKIDKGKGILHSVINTSMLPSNVVSPVFDINISGLFSETSISNILYSYSIALDDDYDIGYIKSAVKNQTCKNVVNIGGNPVKPYQVLDSLISGFKSACTCIIEHKNEFIDIINNPIYINIKVRELLRPTQTYYSYIQASRHPDVIVDKEKFDDVFDILLNNFSPSRFGYLRVYKEIELMKKGFIPSFYVKFYDANLWENNAIVCKNYYAQSPHSVILNSLNNLSYNDIEYQVHLIELSIILMCGDRDLKKNGYVKYPPMNTHNNDLINVDKFVNFLVKNEVPNGIQKSVIFIPQGNGKKHFIASLGNCLYFGSGLILLLGLYGKIFNNSDIGTLSTKLLFSSYDEYLYAKQTQSVINYSVFQGIGGTAYVSYNLYKMYHDPAILNIFNIISNDIFEYYKEKTFTSEIDLDFIDGAAGLIFLFWRIYYDTSSLSLKKKIKEFCINYDNFIKSNKANKKILGVAHGLSGLCMALSCIYRITSDDLLLNIIKNYINEEEILVSNAIVENNIQYSWCRGLSGIILSRCIIADNMKNILTEKVYYNNLMFKYCKKEFVDKMFTINNLCLCHGIYGNLEIFRYLEKYHHSIKYFDEYRNVPFTKDIMTYKWFTHYSYPYESFMVGCGGVAYAMICKNYIQSPSALCLELYKEESEKN